MEVMNSFFSCPGKRNIILEFDYSLLDPPPESDESDEEEDDWSSYSLWFTSGAGVGQPGLSLPPDAFTSIPFRPS